MTAQSFLIDTHIFLWWVEEHPRLTRRVRDALENSSNRVFVSPAVTWEVAIKSARGKMKALEDPMRYILDSGFTPLSITHAHARTVGELPPIHHDPFDRIQLAQAKHNGLTFITADKVNLSYPHIAMLAA